MHRVDTQPMHREIREHTSDASGIHTSDASGLDQTYPMHRVAPGSGPIRCIGLDVSDVSGVGCG